MKKKIFAITSIMLIIVSLCSLFVACKSAEEKEKDYYETNALAIESATDTLSSLTDEVFSKAWTSSFVLAMTYYKTDSEKIYSDGTTEKYSNGSVYGSSIKRGSTTEAGWPVKEVKPDNADYTIKNSTDQYVYFMAFDVDFKSLDNYTVKTTLFNDVKRSDYINKISKKNYREKFEIAKEFEYTVKDGVASGELNQGINPIYVIKMSTDKETIRETGIAASDNFRIYTHFMRIESRTVFGANNALITKEVNDESGKIYWQNYGDDITYDWNNVYSMNNNRLTVLYSKGKNKINSLEIYNESILSYYTKNNNVDKSLVLKADVIAFTEMVVEFKYA
ncbi:MAG: hypothetical protein K2O95_00345 [Clostridia bacterium]|nr:hypothetical protein [Clostridia bacterium]MDE7078550.1 hypothetical protein [Clostridia bacterium]